MRITRIVVASVVLSTALDGQSRGQSGTLTFDVASIRPLENAKPYAIGPPVNGAVRARGIDVRRLVSTPMASSPWIVIPSQKAVPSGLTETYMKWSVRGLPT